MILKPPIQVAQAAKSAAEAEASSNTSSTAASGEFKVELEGEQVWLTGLHEFIQQGLRSFHLLLLNSMYISSIYLHY